MKWGYRYSPQWGRPMYLRRRDEMLRERLPRYRSQTRMFMVRYSVRVYS